MPALTQDHKDTITEAAAEWFTDSCSDLSSDEEGYMDAVKARANEEHNEEDLYLAMDVPEELVTKAHEYFLKEVEKLANEELEDLEVDEEGDDEEV